MSGSHQKDGSGHLWVIGLIAASAAVVVTATWTGIGNVAGFPALSLGRGLRVPTGIALATGTEGYTGYAVWAWLGGAAGDRSRKFAGVTAIGALALSLAVQAPYHLMIADHWARPPALLVIGASSIVVVDVILATALAHLMHDDAARARQAEAARAEAERQAKAEREENDERARLRAQLEAERATAEATALSLRAEFDAERREREEALAAKQAAARDRLAAEREARAAEVSDLREGFARELAAVSAQARDAVTGLQERLDEAVSDRQIAQEKAAGAIRRADALERKVAAMSDPKPRRSAPAARDGGEQDGDGDRDLSTELLALMELRADPALRAQRMGAELGRRIGVSPATGGRLHRRLTRQGSINEDAARSLTEGSG